jgi:bifunctional UDP-N-acetylglucosamine pyrophosphorylase/glucosamine-1-phosphate N-acetyltransferase
VLRDCEVATGAIVYPYVVAEESRVGEKAWVGPFARLRMNANVDVEARVGNFVELKKTQLGRASKAQHLAYLGDATIGENVNIGAGTITCNYDGFVKSRTEIGNGAFVGSNSTLVAPLEIGKDAYIGAGSVITKKVEQDSLAIGRGYQTNKEGWAKRRREQKGNKRQG